MALWTCIIVQSEAQALNWRNTERQWTHLTLTRCDSSLLVSDQNTQTTILSTTLKKGKKQLKKIWLALQQPMDVCVDFNGKKQCKKWAETGWSRSMIWSWTDLIDEGRLMMKERFTPPHTTSQHTVFSYTLTIPPPKGDTFRRFQDVTDTVHELRSHDIKLLGWRK